MCRRSFFVGAGLAVALLATGCATTPPPSSPAQLRQQVADTERAFAKTMANRDHAAFTAFLSDEAVFVTGPEPSRGKQAVATRWERYFEAPQAPFSWEPADVEVLPSGTLALSSGPVRDRDGKLIATFTSIWRLEAPGTWRIVFDKGCEVCAKP
jgi:ketosteroid isomerase-like protein